VAVVEETQFFVTVDGKDVSNRFASRLISLTITDNSGETADTCRFCLDDKGSTIVMPKKGAPIKIMLGSLKGSPERVFDGLVDDVQSEGTRGGGMVLWIDGKSIDTEALAKVKRRKHWDNKTVGEAMKEAAKDAKMELTVADRIDKLKRTYIAQDNESSLHFIQRLARETGGTFKVIGGSKGVVLDRNEGKTAGGGSGAEITVTIGQDVISWQVSPLITRPKFDNVTARWYDKKEAKYKEQKVEVPDKAGTDSGEGAGHGAGGGGGGGGTTELPDVDDNVRNTRVDEEEADQVANAGAKESSRSKGAGHVIIDGNAKPKAEGKLTIKGARPGIDGTYVIDYVMHELSKGDGWTTTISVAKPDTGGGDDRRETTEAPSTPPSGETSQLPE
jgi:uncharacterized protein